MVREGRDERVRRIAAALKRMSSAERGRLADAARDLETLIDVLEREA